MTKRKKTKYKSLDIIEGKYLKGLFGFERRKFCPHLFCSN